MARTRALTERDQRLYLLSQEGALITKTAETHFLEGDIFVYCMGRSVMGCLVMGRFLCESTGDYITNLLLKLIVVFPYKDFDSQNVVVKFTIETSEIQPTPESKPSKSSGICTDINTFHHFVFLIVPVLYVGINWQSFQINPSIDHPPPPMHIRTLLDKNIGKMKI